MWGGVGWGGSSSCENGVIYHNEMGGVDRWMAGRLKHGGHDAAVLHAS